jgi:hypothetical protein
LRQIKQAMAHCVFVADRRALMACVCRKFQIYIFEVNRDEDQRKAGFRRGSRLAASIRFCGVANRLS